MLFAAVGVLLVLFLCDVISQLSQHILSKLSVEATLNSFFDDIEQFPFPKEELRRYFPQPVEQWTVFGNTQSVSWDWVMLMELSMASFLSPTARPNPTPSVNIYGIVWSFLLHSGATSSSNLIQVYQHVQYLVHDRSNRRHMWAENNRNRCASENPCPVKFTACWGLVLGG